MNKLIGIIIVLILIAVGMFIYFSSNDGVDIKNTYTSSGEITKIVYDVKDGSSVSDYKEDCLVRNGIFQECGNTCEPGADACDTVCAMTCTFE